MPAAILLAAGSSQRMGRLGKKELLLLDGRPVLSYSVEAFLKTGLFSTILVTCPRGQIDSIRSVLSTYSNLEFTEGGSTRQESVRLSLEYLEERTAADDLVLIHDGARPWVSSEIILSVYRKTKEKDAAIAVEPSTSAMKTLAEDGRIIRHLERTCTWAAQTPQGFRFNRILEAHRRVQNQDRLFIDDSEIWDFCHGSVWTVAGDPANKKITYSGDIS